MSENNGTVSMTPEQQKTVSELKEYAASEGKSCEFEFMPDSDILSYAEVVRNGKTGIEYVLRILIRSDGAVRSMGYTGLNFEEADRMTVEEYIGLLNRAPGIVEYTLSEDNTLLADIVFTSKLRQLLGTGFAKCVFEYLDPELERFFEGLISLLKKEMTVEEAVNRVRGEKEDKGESLADFLGRCRFIFEHQVLRDSLLTQPDMLSALREEKENFLYNMSQKVFADNGAETPFYPEDFSVRTEQCGDWELIRMTIPFAANEFECKEIVLAAGKDLKRYFTVELGSKNKKLFICEWELNDGNADHVNYASVDADSTGYIDIIKKIIE